MNARNLLIGAAAMLACGIAFADGDSRPTTPQEKAYSLKIKKALRDALTGIDKLDWSLTDDGSLAADDLTSPDQAQRPYAVGYDVQLGIKPETARMQRLSKAMETIMAQLQAGKMPADYVARVNALQKEQSPYIAIRTNEPAGNFTLFEENGAKWQKISVPGAKFAVRATKVQSLNGGGEDSSFDATFLYLGSYSEPRKTEDATVGADGGLKPGAKELVLHNVFIRVEAPHAVADELVKAINLPALNALIGK